MVRVSKKGKKKSNNTNQITKLSDIVPELAVYDIVKKKLCYALLFTIAKCTARYSAEKNFSTSRKSKIESLFLEDYFLAVRSSLDYLLTIEDLSRGELNRGRDKLEGYYDKIKDLLFESLNNNVPNPDKFNELEKEGIKINQGLDFDAGTYLARGVVDETTGFVKYPKPTKQRQKTSGSNLVKLTAFLHKNCEETECVESKAKRIHRLAKAGDLSDLPCPKNNPEGNQTKLYDEIELKEAWPKLKIAMPNLPNLKAEK